MYILFFFPQSLPDSSLYTATTYMTRMVEKVCMCNRPVWTFWMLHLGEFDEARCLCLSISCLSPDDSAEMQRAKLERSGFPDVVHLLQVEADEGSDAAATHPPASGDGQATNIAVALGAHPARWQACTDPQTGCTYYQKTKCEHPSAIAAVAPAPAGTASFERSST